MINTQILHAKYKYSRWGKEVEKIIKTPTSYFPEHTKVSQIRTSSLPTAALLPMLKSKLKAQTRDEIQNKTEDTESHIFCLCNLKVPNSQAADDILAQDLKKVYFTAK